MEQDYKKEIEEIIGQIQCPKDFKCYKSGFQVLCKARDMGIEPLRAYIVKKLKK